MSATNVRSTGAVLALGLALALGPGARSASEPRHEPLQVADMGMGPAGPELGGSQDDMVLEDPGFVPPEAQMDVGDPGHIPPEAQMDLQQPMDDDLQDNIVE